MEYFSMIIFAFVFGTLILEVIISNQLTLEEKKSKLIVQKKFCSGIIKGFRYRGPFIRFALYNKFLVISTFKKRIILLREIINIDFDDTYNQKLIIKAHVKNNTQEFTIFLPQAKDILNKILKLKNNS